MFDRIITSGRPRTIHVGDVHFQRAEAPGERFQVRRLQRLLREADHAMAAQRRLDGAVVGLGQGLGQVDIQDAGAQRAPPATIFMMSPFSGWGRPGRPSRDAGASG
ncbi:hypothetical protein WJ972_30350 [Achromobacter insuavis]